MSARIETRVTRRTLLLLGLIVAVLAIPATSFAAPPEPQTQKPQAGAQAVPPQAPLQTTVPAPEAPGPIAFVCLDPGHGGDDFGARGRIVSEKNLSLSLCRLVKKLLESKGYRVTLTRAGDYAVPVEERTGAANHLSADALVSIHAGSSMSGTAAGPQIFSHGAFGPGEPPRDSGGWQDVSPAARAEGVRLARAISSGLESAGHPPASVRQAPMLVLAGARMAAALVEVGNLPQEEQGLAQAAVQKTIARGIARGIDDFFRPEQSVKPGQAPEAEPDSVPGVTR